MQMEEALPVGTSDGATFDMYNLGKFFRGSVHSGPWVCFDKYPCDPGVILEAGLQEAADQEARREGGSSSLAAVVNEKSTRLAGGSRFVNLPVAVWPWVKIPPVNIPIFTKID